MKKRKIFYFLKTKEEYDYMLSGGLIPRRGIVLIESTQEIYRDKKPYSGYGPLKSYFENLRTDLQSLIQDKNTEVTDSVQNIYNEIHEDLETYNSQFQTKLNEQQQLINTVKSGLTDSNYYINHTIVPSLQNYENSINTLQTNYSDLSVLVATKVNELNQTKSILNTVVSNLDELTRKHNSDITELNDYIQEIVSTRLTTSNTNTESSIKDWVKTYISQYQFIDSDFITKVSANLDLSKVDQRINTYDSTIKSWVNSQLEPINSSISWLRNKVNLLLSNSGNQSQTEEPNGNEEPIVVSGVTLAEVQTEIQNYYNQHTLAIATTSTAGIVKIKSTGGIGIDETGGIYIKSEIKNEIKDAILSQLGITPGQQHQQETQEGNEGENQNSYSSLNPELIPSINANWINIKNTVESFDQGINDTVASKVQEVISQNYSFLSRIKNKYVTFEEIFSDNTIESTFKNQLVSLGLLVRNLDQSVSFGYESRLSEVENQIVILNNDFSTISQGYTGTLGGLIFKNGICTGSVTAPENEDNNDPIDNEDEEFPRPD